MLNWKLSGSNPQMCVTVGGVHLVGDHPRGDPVGGVLGLCADAATRGTPGRAVRRETRAESGPADVHGGHAADATRREDGPRMAYLCTLLHRNGPGNFDLEHVLCGTD